MKSSFLDNNKIYAEFCGKQQVFQVRIAFAYQIFGVKKKKKNMELF